MKRSVVRNIVLVGMLSLIGCSSDEQMEASMIAIIANPSSYNHQSVITYGFLRIDPQARLYVTREDALNANKFHSILMDDLSSTQLIELKACANKYVTVSAEISSTNKTHIVFVRPLHVQSKPAGRYADVVCKIMQA